MRIAREDRGAPRAAARLGRAGAVSLLVGLLGCAGEEALPPVGDPLEYVDPFIGTGGFGFQHGSCFVGAAAPHGLAKAGPDTRGPFGTVRFLHFSGYWHGDDIVQGFSHLHLHGTGAPDYGVLTLMPTDGFDPGRTTPEGYESRMDKESEVARPGYYAVTLRRGGVRAEIAATPHAAHHRYAFAPGAERQVVLDLDHHLDGGSVRDAEVEVLPERRLLRGRLRSLGAMSAGFGGADVFFVVRSARAFAGHLCWRKGATPRAVAAESGQGVGCALRFAAEGDPVELQVGLSLVSIEGAEANLEAEMPGFAFEAARQRTEEAWRQLLTAVRVEGGSRAERRTFYTALYHAYLMPTIHSDVDGRYRGHDGVVRRAEGHRFLSDLSLWDTYRTAHPLYALLAPELARDAAWSLHEMARHRGFFPKWPLAGGDSGTMIGASAELVVADAHLRGVGGFDVDGAYQVLRAAALDAVAPAGGRGGRDAVEPYQRLGYVPAGHGGSVSLTTEYARGDDALGRLAAALGREEDARLLKARSLGYRKLFDPGTGFLRPRHPDGSLSELRFDPLCFCADYTEANAWQSLWMPSFDASGLMALLGGQGPFVARLGEFFERARDEWEASDPKSYAAGAGPRPYYWHGNQPSIHAAYLFAQAGRPDLAQRWVRWVMTTLYSDGPDGLAGNDDGGTLSSWYVFSALGLYPQAGSDEYILGAPLFPRAEVRLPGGVLQIVADGRATGRSTARAVELDGAPLQAPLLRHGDLRPGRTLRFLMAEGP